MKKFTILLLFLSLSFACSNDDDNNKLKPCTTEVVAGLEILVTDAQNVPVIEGITVTATDGDYIEKLEPRAITKVFTGASERAGTYVITITGDGYEPYTSEAITVEADRCHVVTQKATIKLSPSVE